jgi:hypothetical protein
MDYYPVIIIGAPRSGTNMLRDVLCNLKDVSTWPCDEINYIWRHGNARYPSDAFPITNATESVSKYIRQEFSTFANINSAKYLIEKTCANSLRVPFVDAVLPEAKYIYIVRNGVDVVYSAVKRWKANLDISYILKKARYIPKGDLPYYMFQYFSNRAYKIFSKENRLKTWGPRIDYVQFKDLKSIEELCATQWNECVKSSDQAFYNMNNNKVHYVKYEDFVTNPQNEIKKIGNFLNWDYSSDAYQAATKDVRKTSVGMGKKKASNELLKKINPIIEKSLKHHGY